MIKSIFLPLLIFLVCIFTGNSLSAQTATADTGLQQRQLNNAVKLFYSSLGKESPLYNGPEYVHADLTIKGNPFFLDEDAFRPGDVSYDGLFFRGAPMMYDIHKDQVVILLQNKFSKVVLLQKLVKGFDYLNHHFININADTVNTNNSGITSGYYDVAYNGKTQVLIKRYKNIQTASSSETYFDVKRDFYIKKNNAYYSISGQGALIAVLKDRKKELQEYIRSNKIKFRKDPENSMIKIVAYYDHLTN